MSEYCNHVWNRSPFTSFLSSSSHSTKDLPTYGRIPLNFKSIISSPLPDDCYAVVFPSIVLWLLFFETTVPLPAYPTHRQLTIVIRFLSLDFYLLGFCFLRTSKLWNTVPIPVVSSIYSLCSKSESLTCLLSERSRTYPSCVSYFLQHCQSKIEFG